MGYHSKLALFMGQRIYPDWWLSTNLWLLDYDGDNHAIQRLQLDMCGYFFTIANCPGHMLEDANYFLRLSIDLRFDQLLKIYKMKSSEFSHKYPVVTGEIGLNNLPGMKISKSVRQFTALAEQLMDLAEPSTDSTKWSTDFPEYTSTDFNQQSTDSKRVFENS